MGTKGFQKQATLQNSKVGLIKVFLKAQMWKALLGLLLLILSGCQGRNLPSDGLQVDQEDHLNINVTHSTYQIEGSTAEELREQLDQHGVEDEYGERFDGHTQWQIVWSYPYHQDAGTCSIGQVEVIAEITIMLPEWEPPEGAPKTLISSWEEFVGALRAHEEDHQDISIEAAGQIYEALSNLPTYPTCEELEQAADEVGENILENYREMEAVYDAETNHGREDGAHFP